ncbi:hypothetical protein GCM10023145_21430 [Angustibacter luteus]|uniref:Flp pilus-assembly TadG-like N-terminal domain-containing protein n=2 Tax=Angustibacter luteus TaxID=658456 RepID=A0ABW1JA79_9ACTN
MLSQLRFRLGTPARGSGDDSGFAMVTVLAIGFVMSTLMLATLAYAAQVAPQARHSQDWNAALAAAQAGVDDYVSRLNKADSYALSVDCTNIAMQGPDAPTNSCPWNTGSTTVVGWQNVKPGDAAAGQFHYTPSYEAGSVRLTATGKVRSEYRTLDVRVARGGSTDFLYYTDFEDADPANQVSYTSTPTTACGKDGSDTALYWYEKTKNPSTLVTDPTTTSGRRGCSEIQFAPGDVLNGRVHFNDTPLIGSGSPAPQFLQGYETSDPNCVPAKATTKGYCYRSSSGGAPNVGSKGSVFAPIKQLPDNSDQFASYPGCVYYGDTRIRFKSDGTMDIWNTSSSGKTLTGPNTPAGTNCGDATKMVPTNGSDPRPSTANKQNVPIPTDKVIYVRNTGASNTCAAGEVVNGTSSGSTSNDVIPQGTGTTEQGVTDVNYWWPGKQATKSVEQFTVKSTTSGGKTTYSWNQGTQADTVSTSDSSHYVTFNCGQGNVYVEGTVKGRVTIAAENNIVVTGDLLVDGTTAPADPTGTNIVGLVAANSVVVYHPVVRTGTTLSTGTTAVNSNRSGITCSGTVGSTPSTTPTSAAQTTTCTWTKDQDISGGSLDDLAYPNQTSSTGNRFVYASIQTLQHSFWVQTYNQGDKLGKLSVRGSIAQRWRGAVGTSGNTGYTKDYKYDPRLKFSSPPYFPQWTNATWSAATTGELKPKYVGQ